jgi:hypothetical protein
VALAVDVGHLYAERRHMQNAADAGALEAARARCFDNYTASAAATRGQTFTQTNNNRPEALSQGYTVVPTTDWQFDATAWEVVRLYFAGVLGVAPIRVEATAAAACGPDNKPCSLFPVAFKKQQWEWVISKPNPCVDNEFYVWTSNHDKDAGDSDFAPMCSQCKCDVDKDGTIDEVISETGRAWLDFTDVSDPLYPDSCAEKNGCGASELKCWISGDRPGQIILPACVDGDQGVKAGVKKEIEARAKLKSPGNLARVPLYEGTCGAGKGGCSDKYFVTDVGCVEIAGWEQNVKLDFLDGKKNCWKGKLVKVKVACGCQSSCGSTIGGGPSPSGVNTVSLIR